MSIQSCVKVVPSFSHKSADQLIKGGRMQNKKKQDLEMNAKILHSKPQVMHLATLPLCNTRPA